MGRLWFLDKILPPENKIFFDGFENAAAVCEETAIFLDEIIGNGEINITEEVIIKAKTLKHKSANIEKDTIQKLNNTFITPIDREDIQVLASKLHKITKRMMQVCFNLQVYRLQYPTEQMAQQAKTILKATEELVKSVSLIKTISKTQDIAESHSRMKEIETYGDEIVYKAMDELFSGKFEALDVIKLKNIYKDLENVLDNCLSVSEEIFNIALKNN